MRADINGKCQGKAPGKSGCARAVAATARAQPRAGIQRYLALLVGMKAGRGVVARTMRSPGTGPGGAQSTGMATVGAPISGAVTAGRAVTRAGTTLAVPT